MTEIVTSEESRVERKIRAENATSIINMQKAMASENARALTYTCFCLEHFS
jgi:hypothetical protein